MAWFCKLRLDVRQNAGRSSSRPRLLSDLSSLNADTLLGVSRGWGNIQEPFIFRKPHDAGVSSLNDQKVKSLRTNSSMHRCLVLTLGIFLLGSCRSIHESADEKRLSSSMADARWDAESLRADFDCNGQVDVARLGHRAGEVIVRVAPAIVVRWLLSWASEIGDAPWLCVHTHLYSERNTILG
jgi:hypothetical protein